MRWSHGSRFRLARRARRAVCRPAAARLRLWRRNLPRPRAGSVPEALGVDIDAAADRRLRAAVRRCAGHRVPHDRSPAAIPPRSTATKWSSAWKCSSTAPTTSRLPFWTRCCRVTAPGGTVVISVPIEIGPPLVAKQVRAAWSRSGACRSTRAASVMTPASSCGWSSPGRARRSRARSTPVRQRRPSLALHRAQGVQLAEAAEGGRARFTIERQLFSPMPLLGALLNSQVWFVCRTFGRSEGR